MMASPSGEKHLSCSAPRSGPARCRGTTRPPRPPYPRVEKHVANPRIGENAFRQEHATHDEPERKGETGNGGGSGVARRGGEHHTAPGRRLVWMTDATVDG